MYGTGQYYIPEWPTYLKVKMLRGSFYVAWWSFGNWLTVIVNLFVRLSPILLASGIPEGIAANAIRLSIGRGTELRDVDVVVADLKRAVNEILVEVAMNDDSASARQWHWCWCLILMPLFAVWYCVYQRLGSCFWIELSGLCVLPLISYPVVSKLLRFILLVKIVLTTFTEPEICYFV